jgi:hypothetical protein
MFLLLDQNQKKNSVELLGASQSLGKGKWNNETLEEAMDAIESGRISIEASQ